LSHGKLLLVANGTADDVERAKDLLDETEAESTMVHAEQIAVGV
jgi:hypothetical protein